VITNKRLLNKDEFIKGTIFPSNINFTAEEAEQFIDYIVDQSVLKNNAKIVRMAKPEKLQRTLGIDGKILYPSETFSSLNYKKDVSHNIDTLSVKKARGCVVIYDDDVEDNIEGEAFVDHLMRMIAAGIANDLEEAYYTGVRPVAGTNPLDLNGVWDGWRHRMLTYSNDVTGAATILDATDSGDFSNTTGYIVEQNANAPYDWEFKFAKMLKSMPSKYKKLQGGLANFRFYLNDQLLQDYIDSLAARNTILGDNAILGQGPIQYGRVPIVSMPLMPTDVPRVTAGVNTTLASNAAKGATSIVVSAATGATADDYIYIYKAGLEYKAEVVQIDSVDGTTLNLKTALKWAHTTAEGETVKEVTLDATDCFLTHKDNLIVGILRDIKMETQREAADEATYFFYSLRSDLLLSNPNAVVFLKNLKTK